jgi:hypothetical protein
MRESSFSERIYRLGLRLYPAAFRREFGREMSLDFDEGGRDAWCERGWRGLMLFWGRITADLVATAALQWLRTGLPLITLVSALTAVGVTGAAAQIIVRGPIGASLTRDDEDLLLMLLMIGVVLSVIAATIIFTFCFTRPLQRRRRS